MDYRNLRRHYRAKYFAEVKALIYPENSQDKALAKHLDLIVLNLSIDGVGVISREKVVPGSIFTFTLFLGGIGHEIMGYTTFCTQLGEMYRIGLKIVSPDNMFTSLLLEYIEDEKNM